MVTGQAFTVIQRRIQSHILAMATQYPVVVLSGPRQAGKTTLAQQTFPNHQYILLEDLDVREFARSDPKTFLAQFKTGVILDEAQNVPELFSYLQGIVDRDRIPGKFILTGSQHFLMIEKITQSLAGRAAVIQMLPLSYEELAQKQAPSDIWSMIWKGFYPGIYEHNLDVTKWHQFYFNTYVERDVRLLKHIQDLSTLHKFVRLCAGRIGQLINLSSLGADCGINHETVRSWLSVLEASFIITMVQPHHANFNKRLTKQSKLYFNDTGLACYLLGIDTPEKLDAHHHMRGPLFENYVGIEIIKTALNKGKEPHLYFWRDHHGHEVDFIIEHGTNLIPIEVKASGTITSDFFKGLTYFQNLAGINHGFLVYTGDLSQQRAQCRLLNWKELSTIV